jgi:C-terminal processing protease CtpA/Prc
METQTENIELTKKSNKLISVLKYKKYLAPKLIGLVVLIVAVLVVTYQANTGKLFIPKISKPGQYELFISEIFSTVSENYWDKVSDEQLVNLYTLAIEKIRNEPLPEPKPKTKKEFIKTFNSIIKSFSTALEKEQFSAQISDIVLANLQPFGRSRLYSQQQEQSLKDTIENRNLAVNQYEVLGVPKEASKEEIQKAYKQKIEEIGKPESPEEQQKLAQANHALDTLTDDSARSLYDQTGAEPTMEAHLLTPEIFYVKMDRYSPTMVEELNRVTSKVDTGQQLHILILDLRNNIGGLIDGLPYFLGPFIGPDQYAYQFFHQGEKQDFKTKVGWMQPLIRYKKVIILINENSQSSAEVMAYVLKKYNVGILVGTKTKGWGTVEKVFDIKNQISEKNKYSVFLVHSLTLGDDGQPIEGRGVAPVINISERNWDKELYKYYAYQPLIDAVREVLGK